MRWCGAAAEFRRPVRLDGDHAGLHLSWFPPPVLGQPARLARLAQSCGLDAESVTLDGRGHFPGLCAVLLGFGRLPERQLQARIARFAARARDEAAGSATIPPAATLPASVQSAAVLSAG